ncbi:RNA polymerase sigma factor [Ectocarpus siliculosus]|uniref:RNA polymerase sigma factor n=1 Tax=Ectocarpus siliculosus TaxID=2880 RepID=D7FPX0_ECTSI|nr:RNA polymerase sigma factor [Ectocarpus siliculosus]|eukprot:CBJ48301.1 RNA polymerase sigma factor [Ectocarpus siliculosus]
MGSQARRRRPTRPSPNTCPFLTRALGVACLAGATSLSAGFVTPAGCRGGFYGINSAAAAAAASATTVRQRGSVGGSKNPVGGRDGPIRLRRNHLAMVSATAEPPAATATDADAWAGATRGRRARGGARRTPALTTEEERALLAKIKNARTLRDIQRGLEAAAATAAGRGEKGALGDGRSADGGAGTAVTMGAWAREAGVEVEDLPRVLQEGIEAKQTLVERNMPMVIRMVEGQYRWRLRGGQVSFADLLQEGAYALGVAAERFDPTMPNRFLTYALYTVRDKLDVALARGNSAISVPATALKEVHRARRELTGRLGRTPSEAELANFFANGVVVVGDAEPAASAGDGGIRRGGADGDRGRSTAAGRRARAVTDGEFAVKAASSDREARQQARTRRRRLNLLSAVQKVTSIDRLIRASDGSTMVPLVDTLVGDLEDGQPRSAGGDIAELLPRVLTPRQASLVRMACGLSDGKPMTMAECSKELSLSVARTKSLFDSSLQKLRAAAEADDLGRLVRQP